MSTFLYDKQSIVVKITNVEQTDNFFIYHVSLRVGSISWKVQHRFSEFVELHEKLTTCYGLSKELLPPKKVIGNKDPLFIEKRRAGLEVYLTRVLKYFRKTMPTVLARFLNFQFYDIIFLLQSMALDFFTDGDSFLETSKHYCFTPLQLHAISERLKRPCPSLEVFDKRLDFSHVLDFCCHLKSLIVKGTNTPVGTSNIIPNDLSYELSSFKRVENLSLMGVQVSNIYGIDNVRNTVSSLKVHYSKITKISQMLLCDYLHKDVSCINEGCKWKKITEADLSHNDLKDIDESVRLMPNIEQLNLSNNKITHMSNLTSLPYLSHLYLSTNLITEAQNLHTKMGNVVFLDLSHNNINCLQGFSKLYSLECLDISSNQIADLTEVKHLSGLPCLENLVLNGNPVATIIDYRIKILEQFGNRAAEICLDYEKSNQKELDTVAVLQALRIVKEGRTPVLETNVLIFPHTP